MLFFMLDKGHFVMTNMSEDSIREIWKNYRAYRYDVDFSFQAFLEENGYYVRITMPSFGLFGYDLSDIEFSVN